MVLTNDGLFKMLRKIYILSNNSRISQQTLAIELNMSVRDPRLREILTVMRENHLIIEHDGLNQRKLIEVKFKKLEDYIRKYSQDFAEWGKFIEISKPYSFSY